LNLKPYTLNSPNSRRLLIFLVAAIAAGLTIYRSELAAVINSVLHREGSSHGLFVPFLSAFFVWTNRQALREIEPRSGYAGIPLIAAGLIFPLFDVASYEIVFISFIFFAAGLLITFMGWKFFKAVSFPLFFLVTMTPLTGDTYRQMADITRHITFAGSLFLISLFDIPHFRDGWLIHLPNALLEVAESCSGIRYFISYSIFGLAYAYLMKSTTRARIATVLLTIPISLVASILRLTVIFVMTYTFGPFWAQPRPHIFLSWAVFFGVLILAIALDQYFAGRKKVIRQDRPD